MNQVIDINRQLIDGDVTAIGDLYRQARKSQVDSVKCLIDCGHRLAAKKDSLPHGRWLPWLEENQEILGFGGNTARMLIRAAKAISDQQSTVNLTESEALAISRKIWGNTNHLAMGSGENEWYTPDEYVRRVRNVMGGIDLDPASNAEANATIQADNYFDENQNGLSQEWHGRIWLNPPYSRDLMPAFVAKLIGEYVSGKVSEAVVVSHNNTDTKWFQDLAAFCSAICFPATRIKFYRGEDIAAPVNGQAFFYLGKNPSKFHAEFADLGLIVRPYDPKPETI